MNEEAVIMASGGDLIKYITQRVVTYIDTPKEARKEIHSSKPKEPWKYRWFGMLGMAIDIWMRNRMKRKQNK
jgi:hypothetical protein